MVQTLQKNNFSLVLSGGGALGIAHLGLLHDLEKNDLYPSEIVGTSMGAIIGSCLSIGMKEKDIFALFVEFSNIFNWLKFSFTGNAIIKHKKIYAILDKIFLDRTMKDTNIPLKLITTDLLNGDIRVFTCNDNVKIKDAVLASMAIPGVFEEVSIEGRIYSDGFLCENLGINQASYDTVLASDVLGENSFSSQMPDNFFKTSNILEMFEKSIRILIYNQTKAFLNNSSKNIYLLQANTKNYKTFHFNKYEEIRKTGLNLLK